MLKVLYFTRINNIIGNLSCKLHFMDYNIFKAETLFSYINISQIVLSQHILIILLHALKSLSNYTLFSSLFLIYRVFQLIRDRNFKNGCWRAKGEMFILSSTKAGGMFLPLLSSYIISLSFPSLLR